MTRCAWVCSQKAAGFPVTIACQVAGVSTSSYYAWAAQGVHGPTSAQRDQAHLINEIVTIHRSTDRIYGAPRIQAELEDLGWVVNHKKTARLMRENGIVGVHKPVKMRTTIPAEDNPPIPDRVGRNFAVGAPDCTWVGDITYIATGEGWLYLASVIDLGSRRFLGYSMADHMRTELVLDALQSAITVRGGIVEGVVFHGDRGSQYMSGDYRAALAAAGMLQSVGRTGVCLLTG